MTFQNSQVAACHDRWRRWRWCAAALLLLPGLPSLASAQSAPSGSAVFNIDAQPLPAALKSFIEQTHMQLLYRYDLVKDAVASPVHGSLDQREALTQLLLGTGLEAAFIAENSATLRPLHPEADSQSELDEIIVTARRREESLSKIPVAIAALTGTELHEAGVSSVVQLQYLVPGLMVSRDNQGVNLSIRGVTTTDTTTKGEPGINLNTDGIPVNRSEEQALGFFDLQRVEVLSGPQGTLYGKSSTGGAINAITNQPTQNEEASAAVEVGNYNTRRLDAMINLPLSDVLAVRAAVNANYRDGFVTLIGSDSNRQPDGENNFSGRFSALARFSDDLGLRVTATLGQIGGVGYGNSGVALDVDNQYVGTGTTIGYANRFAGHVSDHFSKGNIQFDAPLGPVHLTWLSSYSHYKTDNLMPNYADGGDGQRLWVRDTYNTTYQELRFTNSDSGRLQYVAGLNYFYEHVQEDGHFWSVGDTSDYLNLINLLNSTSHTTYSAYAHATYELAPRWHITAGLREAADETTRQGTLANGPYAGMDANGPIPWLNRAGTVCTGTEDCVGTPNDGSGKSDKLTWNIGADHQFTPDQMGYVTIATGYKAGGFNDLDPTTNTAREYGPENMTAYEAGYKVRLPSRFQFTSSLYYYDYSADQITQLAEIDNDPNNRMVFTRLVPTTIYGWENSLVLPFTPSDILDLAANFERAYYNRFAAGPTFTTDFSGKSLDRVPATVLSAGFTHHWTLRNGAGLQWHAATRYSSAYFVTDFWAAQQYQQQPFSRSDADLGYASRSGKFTTQIFVRNIENKEQITGGAQNYVPGVRYSASGFVSEPRFWGVRASLRL